MFSDSNEPSEKRATMRVPTPLPFQRGTQLDPYPFPDSNLYTDVVSRSALPSIKQSAFPRECVPTVKQDKFHAP